MDVYACDFFQVYLAPFNFYRFALGWRLFSCVLVDLHDSAMGENDVGVDLSDCLGWFFSEDLSWLDFEKAWSIFALKGMKYSFSESSFEFKDLKVDRLSNQSNHSKAFIKLFCHHVYHD